MPDYCTGLSTDLASCLKATDADADAGVASLREQEKQKSTALNTWREKGGSSPEICTNHCMNNVVFDSSFSSKSFVKCGFIRPSSNVFGSMKPTNFPAVAWYSSRLENEKERNPKLDFFLCLETERSSHIFESNVYSSCCHWPKYYVSGPLF